MGAARETILAPESKFLAKAMAFNPNYGRCTKGVSLLTGWRSQAKAIKNDGHGVALSVENMRAWQATIRSAADFSEMTYALYETLKEIPDIKNQNLRKNAAKLFAEEMASKRNFNIGANLRERLKLIATGTISGAGFSMTRSATGPMAREELQLWA